MYHPVFKNKVGTSVFVAWWVAVAAIHFAIVHFLYNFDSLAAIADSIVWNGLFALVSLGLWFWVRIFDFETQRPLAVALNHLGASIVSILLLVASHRWILSIVLTSYSEYQSFIEESTPGRVIIGFFFYMLVVLVYYLIIYIGNFREKLAREGELKALVKDAELSWLKLQVNPHFLFNSLNSISSLTITSPERAQEMITRLSELLRYSLRQTPDSMVSLRDELDNCTKYLEIEKVRFGSRLNFTIEVNQECMEVQLPSMLLQPLFENAIKHSVAQSANESFINANIEVVEMGIDIKVSNTLPEFPSSSAGTGVGLENIKRRLVLIYGAPNLLNIEKTPASFTVSVLIPKYS